MARENQASQPLEDSRAPSGGRQTHGGPRAATRIAYDLTSVKSGLRISPTIIITAALFLILVVMLGKYREPSIGEPWLEAPPGFDWGGADVIWVRVDELRIDAASPSVLTFAATGQYEMAAQVTSWDDGAELTRIGAGTESRFAWRLAIPAGLAAGTRIELSFWDYFGKTTYDVEIVIS